MSDDLPAGWDRDVHPSGLIGREVPKGFLLLRFKQNFRPRITRFRPEGPEVIQESGSYHTWVWQHVYDNVPPCLVCHLEYDSPAEAAAGAERHCLLAHDWVLETPPVVDCAT